MVCCVWFIANPSLILVIAQYAFTSYQKGLFKMVTITNLGSARNISGRWEYDVERLLEIVDDYDDHNDAKIKRFTALHTGSIQGYLPGKKISINSFNDNVGVNFILPNVTKSISLPEQYLTLVWLIHYLGRSNNNVDFYVDHLPVLTLKIGFEDIGNHKYNKEMTYRMSMSAENDINEFMLTMIEESEMPNLD